MSQVISLRLDPVLAESLRQVANRRGVTRSDLLREAAERIVRYEHDQPAGVLETAVESGFASTIGYIPPSSATWGCQHMTITGPFPYSPSCGCGCDMSPVETATR